MLWSIVAGKLWSDYNIIIFDIGLSFSLIACGQFNVEDRDCTIIYVTHTTLAVPEI